MTVPSSLYFFIPQQIPLSDCVIDREDRREARSVNGNHSAEEVEAIYRLADIIDPAQVKSVTILGQEFPAKP